MKITDVSVNLLCVLLPTVYEAGCLVASQAPGLGLALDDDAVRRFTVELPGA